MPSLGELVGILAVLFFIWLVLKLAKVAIRVIFFVIVIVLIIGALYWLFMR